MWPTGQESRLSLLIKSLDKHHHPSLPIGKVCSIQQ
ncbi:hypothetical protein TIFTF001_037256, partial [Ficus carica]